jgi:hypothetical protein
VGQPVGVRIPPLAHPLTRSFVLHLLSRARGRTVGCQRLVNGTRRLLVAVAQNQPRHRAGRLLIQAGQHVAIGIHGDRDVGVAQALADHLGWDASGQRGGRIAVADVVQPDLGQAGRMGMLLKPSGEALRVDGAAIRPGTRPDSCQRGPTASRCSSCPVRCSRSAATVAGSSTRDRRPFWVLGSETTTS